MTVDIPKLRELIAVMNETDNQDTHEEARAMLVKAMPEMVDELETRRDETRSGVGFWSVRAESAESWMRVFLKEIRELKTERDSLLAQLAELRPTEGAPDEAERFADILLGNLDAVGPNDLRLRQAGYLLRRLAAELRGYRKAVTWGVDTVTEGYRLDAEKLRIDIGVLDAANDELRCVQLPRLETLAAKVNTIRNSIVGAQAVNWSEHIYPLVAALNDAGIGGESYDVARANVSALIDRVRELEERDAAATEYTFARVASDDEDVPSTFQAVAGAFNGAEQRWYVHDVERGRDVGRTNMTKEAAIARAKALAAGEVK